MVTINPLTYLLVITTLLGLSALYFLNKAKAEFTVKAIPAFRLSVKEVLREKRRHVEDWLHDPTLQKQFRDAGNPLGLTGLTYQYIRFGVLLLYLAYSLPNFLTNLDFKSLFATLTGAGFLYFISMPGDYLPITRILISVKNYNTAEKNRELFMLYSLIADEVVSAKDDRMNLLSLLKDMREYTILIRPAIDRALLNWNKGASTALQIMAIEIGTSEADELTKILADLEECDSNKAIQLLSDRQETFIAAQKENKRRKMKTLAQYGYIVAFLPLIVYGWNMLNLVMMEVDLLSDFTNLR